MNYLKSFAYPFICFLLLSLNSHCVFATDKTLYVACTPGDALIKAQLGISNNIVIDFIKWDLTLESSRLNSFELNIVYGESQPNTLGFKNGGLKKSYQGAYRISQYDRNEIYYLKSKDFSGEIAMVKLDATVFHLLTPQKKLMVGNGGWSYTLNKKNPDNNKYLLPVFRNSASILKDTLLQVVYDGRTPCLDFAEENNLTVSESCFKLKWKLILNKDPKTLKPSTYALKRTNSRESDIVGNWKIIKGSSLNPNAIILQLDPDKPAKTISLFVADENVLFFLHKNETLFKGNENFSFTLNKRMNPSD